MNELVKIATDITENDSGIDVVIIGNSEGKIVGASSKNAMGIGVKVNQIIKEFCIHTWWRWWWKT